MAGFVLVCPKRVFLVLKFVQVRVKNVVEDLLIFVLDFAKGAGVAEIGEFLVVSAVSSCVLSLSEGRSVFPG